MKTYHAKSSEIEREWHLVDAADQTLGRLATQIATILMGKHKPTFTPGVDTGDFVVVTNATKVYLSGNKPEVKVYRYHTQWIGGLKETPYRRMMERHPDRIIRLAVRRMLPKSALGAKMLKKLKIYPGTDHPHAAQNPQALSL